MEEHICAYDHSPTHDSGGNQNDSVYNKITKKELMYHLHC